MRLSLPLLTLTLALASSTFAAHSAWCTVNKNGKGATNYQVTKDCCAATKETGTTGFNEASWECQDALGAGNGINLGRFVQCCGSRGAGSHSDG